MGAGQYERRYLAMSIFNEEQIKAMFSREYICHECGHLMEFEDE
jgi:acetone carboxylase gamma subunit